MSLQMDAKSQRKRNSIHSYFLKSDEDAFKKFDWVNRSSAQWDIHEK